MGCVKADWVSQGPGEFSFNPTMTVHGRIYHYLSAMIPSLNLRPFFLSVYIHDTEYVSQAESCAAQISIRILHCSLNSHQNSMNVVTTCSSF